MKTRQEIFEILSQHIPRIQNEYQVERLGVFGSTVRGEQSSQSDIDILVEFSGAIGMVKFIQLENSLQSLLGTKVDLVSKKALKRYIGQQILSEVEYVQ